MHFNIPIFVPHAGCPHDCVFCNQKNITGHVLAQSIEEARQTIDEHLSSIQKRNDDYTVEVAFFGGSFTGIPDEEQIAYLAMAYQYIEAGLIDGIRLSTRPDYIDKEVLKRLKGYGVTTIELGVQSLVEDILIKANRGHDLVSVILACNLIKAYDFKLGLQMMIGLPGDDTDKSVLTAEKIISLKPDMVRIYPTIVVEGTALEQMYKMGLYDPLTIEEAVDWTTEIYKKFTFSNIPVIRMGLQATEALAECVAGPYHPSFRQLVENKLYLESLDCVLEQDEFIKIYVNSKEISNLVGLNRSNLNYLEKKYSIKKISVYPKDLPVDYFEVVTMNGLIKVPKMMDV